MKDDTSRVQVVGGMGFAQVLTIAFIVLKLTGYIAWSWWWVLSPLWIPVLFTLVFMVVGFFVFLAFRK